MIPLHPRQVSQCTWFKIAHLSLIVIDRTKIDPPHSQAVNFNTGTDSPPQCDANARLHSVTPVDKRQHFQ